ncbi:MAG: beta-lactamase family protein [Clostridiales bacterium]|nr:beta-lactamase family protein [Clostridiales bacterium]
MLLIHTLILPCMACSKSDSTSVMDTTPSTLQSEETGSSSTEKGPVDFPDLKESDDHFFINEDTKYEKLIQAVIQSASVNGYHGVMLLATDEEIILFGAPGAMAIDNTPSDPYTIYEVGSISKTFTAVMVMKLIDQGKMRMDDYLAKYFPEYKAGREITIANLLNMQSGIVDYVNQAEVFFAGADRDPEEIITTAGLTDEEFLSFLYAQDLQFEPGTKTRYCNTNYHLLALIIEQLTGESFGEAVKREIFDPLGMTHSSAMTVGDETSVPDSTIGYHQFQEGARGAGDIHSCMADMIVFDRALFDGDLISVKSLTRMKDFKDGNYGCGLFPYGEHAYGHSGSVACYGSENVVFETEEFGRVYFIASTADPDCMMGLESIVSQLTGYLKNK